MYTNTANLLSRSTVYSISLKYRGGTSPQSPRASYASETVASIDSDNFKTKLQSS